MTCTGGEAKESRENLGRHDCTSAFCAVFCNIHPSCGPSQPAVFSCQFEEVARQVICKSAACV